MYGAAMRHSNNEMSPIARCIFQPLMIANPIEAKPMAVSTEYQNFLVNNFEFRNNSVLL